MPKEMQTKLRNGIHIGYACEHKKFEEMYERCTGKYRAFDPMIFQLSPCGSRILIVRDEAPEKVGQLIVPESVAQKNPPGAGYIVAVGDMVGQGTAPHPHGVRCDNSKELLYQRIIFGMYSAHEFFTRPYAMDGFTTEYWILTERDVWFIDWSNKEEDQSSEPYKKLMDSVDRNE